MVKASGVKSVPSDVFIAAYAAHLQKGGAVEIPSWHEDVKTASRKQMPPQSPEWLYTRIASVARQLYIHPKGVGVGQLARFYGGRTRNTQNKKHFRRSSRGIIRYALKQLVALGYASDVEVDDKTLRQLTSKGVSDLDQIAKECEGATGLITDVSEYNEEIVEQDDFDGDEDEEDIEDESDELD